MSVSWQFKWIQELIDLMNQINLSYGPHELTMYSSMLFNVKNANAGMQVTT